MNRALWLAAGGSNFQGMTLASGLVCPKEASPDGSKTWWSGMAAAEEDVQIT